MDFRQLNAATVKDAHHLPRIDNLLDALHSACWFSTLDLKSGYWQVPICKEDKPKTSFWTGSGQLYEFNQVQFILCKDPATFSRFMDHVLTGLNWETYLFYLDDIIVSSKTWEEHLEHLEGMFQGLQEAKLKLGGNKCPLAAPEVSYLGHHVMMDRLLPDPILLRTIREIPMPQSVKEVRSFLELASYYRCYVKGFAAIASPLHALMKKEMVFHWPLNVMRLLPGSNTCLRQPYHCLPRLQPALLVVDQCLDLTLGCHLGTGARWVRKNQLLHLLCSVTDREELSSYQAGMFGYHVGKCQAASPLDGKQV